MDENGAEIEGEKYPAEDQQALMSEEDEELKITNSVDGFQSLSESASQFLIESYSTALSGIQQSTTLAAEVATSILPYFQFASDAAVFVMGNRVSLSAEEKQNIQRIIRSRIWVTYRRNFPAIADSNVTSDKGWGCMLRCCQMVVAECLVRLHCGKNWNWSSTDSWPSCPAYRSIIRAFADDPTAAFGIHQLTTVDRGKTISPNPMDDVEDRQSLRPIDTWFGPNTIAQTLKKLTESGEPNNSTVSNLSDEHRINSNCIHVHVALDNLLVIDDVRRGGSLSSTSNSPDRMSMSTLSADAEIAVEVTEDLTTNAWKPLLLFIPLRLGLVEMNPIYIPDIKACFEIDSCVGIIGGRPDHALYFIGSVSTSKDGKDPTESGSEAEEDGEQLVIYLDPHTTQDAVVDWNSTQTEPTSSTASEDGFGTTRFDWLMKSSVVDSLASAVSAHSQSISTAASNLVSNYNCSTGSGSSTDNAESDGSTPRTGERSQWPDSTYHTDRLCTMPLRQIDPSISLCFFCPTEADFDRLCSEMVARLVENRPNPLFNVCQQRPVSIDSDVPKCNEGLQSNSDHQVSISNEHLLLQGADNDGEDFEVL